MQNYWEFCSILQVFLFNKYKSVYIYIFNLDFSQQHRLILTRVDLLNSNLFSLLLFSQDYQDLVFNLYKNMIFLIKFLLVAWVYFNQSRPSDSKSAFRFSLAPTVFISFQFLHIYRSIKNKRKKVIWLHGLFKLKWTH